MSSPLEPADRRHLRVSDADREQVAEVLRQAAGDGRLTLEELDGRLEQAYAAKTYADLEPVTRDLPAYPAAPEPAVTGVWAERIGGTPGAAFSVAIMSGATRAGRWVVPPRYTAFAFMGGIELDLRHARFSEREVTIYCFCLMGGVSIIAPPDIEVDVSGIGFMGAFDHRGSGPGTAGAPVVRVTGFALMGGVNVARRSGTGPDEGPRLERGHSDLRRRELRDARHELRDARHERRHERRDSRRGRR